MNNPAFCNITQGVLSRTGQGQEGYCAVSAMQVLLKTATMVLNLKTSAVNSNLFSTRRFPSTWLMPDGSLSVEIPEMTTTGKQASLLCSE
jgi:hypothetical protein